MTNYAKQCSGNPAHYADVLYNGLCAECEIVRLNTELGVKEQELQVQEVEVERLEAEVDYLRRQNKGFQSQYIRSGEIIYGLRDEAERLRTVNKDYLESWVEMAKVVQRLQSEVDGGNAAIESLQSVAEGLSARMAKFEGGLQWQTGKPPCDGWYWQSFHHKWEGEEWWDSPEPTYMNKKKRNERSVWIQYRWSGPISEPGKE